MNCPDCGRPMVEQPVDITLGIGWQIRCKPCGNEFVGRSMAEARMIYEKSEANNKGAEE